MIKGIVFNDDGSHTITNADGSTTLFTSTAPVVAPTDTEIDILRSDGSVVKVQIPAA